MKKIVLPAKIGTLYQVLEFVVAEAKGTFAEENSIMLELAVEEVFVNIASYAYEESTGSESIDSVEIECGLEGDLFIIRFIDEGIPFDMTKIQSPDITETAKEREIGGLGIHLVKEVMDYIHYEYKDKKNILTMGMTATKQ
ncbi:MAG: ATP-binding protein [Anaerovoracaceae bacterium]